MDFANIIELNCINNEQNKIVFFRANLAYSRIKKFKLLIVNFPVYFYKSALKQSVLYKAQQK